MNLLIIPYSDLISLFKLFWDIFLDFVLRFVLVELSHPVFLIYLKKFCSISRKDWSLPSWSSFSFRLIMIIFAFWSSILIDHPYSIIDLSISFHFLCCTFESLVIIKSSSCFVCLSESLSIKSDCSYGAYSLHMLFKIVFISSSVISIGKFILSTKKINTFLIGNHLS